MRIVITILSLLTLSACGLPGQTCAQTAGPFLGQLQGLAREWDDANKLADQTPRASLAAQIQNLQAIRRKVQDLQAPDCAKPAQTDLAASMDAAIEGYLAFLAQKSDGEVKAHFDKAATSMESFRRDIAGMASPP